VDVPRQGFFTFGGKRECFLYCSLAIDIFAVMISTGMGFSIPNPGDTFARPKVSKGRRGKPLDPEAGRTQSAKPGPIGAVHFAGFFYSARNHLRALPGKPSYAKASGSAGGYGGKYFFASTYIS